MNAFRLLKISHEGAVLPVVFVGSMFWGLLFGTVGQALAFHHLEKSIGIRVGGVMFPTQQSSGPEVETDSAPVVGLTAGVRQGRLSLELSADWIRSEFQQDFISVLSLPPVLILGPIETVEVKLDTIPILLTGQLHLLKEGGVVDPYLGVGGGYYINWFSPTRSQGIDVDVDNAFGVHAGLGTAIRISPVMAVTIDGRYFWARPSLSYKDNNSGSPSLLHETLSYSGFVATVGMRYTFPQ